MKCSGKIAVCLVVGLMLDVNLHADDVALTGNPYALIVARNIFSLNPPPPPVDLAPTPATPSVKITLTGIMSVFGQRQAIFKTSGGGKPGEQSYILGEGQREDEIEVVKIDENTGIITFNNHGVVQDVPLAGPSANSAPKGTTTAFNPTTSFPLPNIGNKGGNSSSLNANIVVGRGIAGGQSGVNGSVPKFVTTTHNSTAPQQQAAIDPDVQKVLIVANHLKAQLDGDPVAKIYPPTELDNEAGVTSNVAQSTNSPSLP